MAVRELRQNCARIARRAHTSWIVSAICRRSSSCATARCFSASSCSESAAHSAFAAASRASASAFSFKCVASRLARRSCAAACAASAFAAAASAASRAGSDSSSFACSCSDSATSRAFSSVASESSIARLADAAAAPFTSFGGSFFGGMMYGSSRRVAASEPATAFGAMRAFLRLSASFAACAFRFASHATVLRATPLLRCSESGPVEDAGVATELSAPAATEESTARDLAASLGEPRVMGI